jgi:hypothetical protein
VGLYHLNSQNWHGATILLGEGTSRLPAYLPNYQSVNVEGLLEDSLHLLRIIQTNGKEGIGSVLQSIDLGNLKVPHISRFEADVLQE